jgi:hypothetical protein
MKLQGKTLTFFKDSSSSFLSRTRSSGMSVPQVASCFCSCCTGSSALREEFDLVCFHTLQGNYIGDRLIVKQITILLKKSLHAGELKLSNENK